MIPSRLVFPLSAILALIAFYPTIGSGFVFDFVGWQRQYDQGTFADIIHCFGYKGNHQILHLFFYSLYALFHIQGLPWYLVFCLIHAGNAWLLYKWLQLIRDEWKITLSNSLIVLLCLFYLFHPYNVEPVVWKACIHYLLSMSAVLGIMIFSTHFIQRGERRFLFIALLLFLCSLFLLEVSYVTPLVMTVFFIIHFFVLEKQKATARRSIQLGGGMWLGLILCLLVNKITLGEWVGHYGPEMHLRIDMIGMMSNEVKYLVKNLADARYFSFQIKALLFDRILSNPEFIFFMLVLCITGLMVYAIRIDRRKRNIHLGVFGLIASLIYTLPVSNMYFYHLHVDINDRLGYLPLLFLWIGIWSFLGKAPKWISYGIVIPLLLIQIYLQQKTIRYWKESTQVLESLKKDYRWHDHSHVFILNSPDNYRGIQMASIIKAPSGIDELIDFQTDRLNNGVTYDIFQFNMNSMHDGVTVEQTDSLQLKVTFKQWGNWWHRDGIGATSYENEFYRAEVLDYPYQVTFKQLPEGSVILYQDGMQWKEFEFSK
jgi:hypothetical protein